MEEVKALRRSALAALLSMLAVILLLGSATYAWFTFTTSTNVRGWEGSVAGGEGDLSIANSPEGPFDLTCELVLASPVETLEPISTADLVNFYASALQSSDGITRLYRPAESPETRAIHGTVYLRADQTRSDVYFWPDALGVEAEPQVLAALRLGLRITTEAGTVTRIFTLDALGNTAGAQSRQTVETAGTVVSQVGKDGRAALVSDPAESLTAYLASGQGEDVLPGERALCSLEAGETAAVEYWLYLEGCDDNCFDPVQSREVALTLGFAGA